MAKVSINGLDEFMQRFGLLANSAHGINRGALGEGAKVAADAIGNALQGLPVCDEGYTPPGRKRVGATASEKEQIISQFGISRFKDNGGSIKTSIGFTGYVNTPSKRFDDQVPTGMLMQCIEYGTDFRNGTHTISNAIKQSKEAVNSAVQKYIDDATAKIME